jgi:hypothetical protein
VNARDQIKTLRGYNEFVVHKNMEGVTQEESLRRPDAGGNCMNWVLGHILLHRNPMLTALGKDPIWPRERCEPYARGSEGHPGDGAAEVSEMLAAIADSHARIEAALDEATDEALDAPVEANTETTVAERVIGLQFHEAYHAGQLGVLRRLTGRDGALK